MTARLDTRQAEFAEAFGAILASRDAATADVRDVVSDIIADVRANGDSALIRLTSRFDRLDLTPDTLAVGAEELAAAEAAISEEQRAALTTARDRIESHHRRQIPQDDRYTDTLGIELGSRWTPLDAVGLYVPGGTAAYPSSVLMNAVPARVAGVERIVMVVPSPDGVLNPLVLAAARLAGVDTIYRLGGAQAVAALAYGTRTIAPVDKIVGPGNAYVAEAKRQVFGRIGIDMIAGPSEVLIVADADNDPDWLAADLLAQAEHDASSQSVLITTDATLADRTADAVERQLAGLPRVEIAGASWRDHGAIIVTDSLERAMELANAIAPEHIELAVEDPEALLPLLRHAGAAFLGRHTPEALGDYVAGSNHVLPTARAARFASGLSVLDFMKRTSILRTSADGLAALAGAATTLAAAEGLDAHARSISIRTNRG